MAKTLTKSQIVRTLAEKMDIPKKTAGAFLEELVNLAVKETKTKGTFQIPGIGKLRKAHRKARMGRNPQTGEALKIPAKTVVRFRVSKVCKEAVVGKR
ncbi:MAG: HU family DNA-binding protein [Terriglobia bacterium]